LIGFNHIQEHVILTAHDPEVKGGGEPGKIIVGGKSGSAADDSGDPLQNIMGIILPI